MRTFLILLALLASASVAAQDAPQAPAGAAPDSDYLGTMPLGDLVPRTEVRGGTRETDWLPPGASFDRAPRMVLVHRISGPADAGAPVRFIEGLATCLRPCPGQRVGAIDRTPFDGHPAARAVIDMPPGAVFSGLPTRTYVLAVAGDSAVHALTIVLRGARSPADERFAADVLRSATLCTPFSSAGACRPR
jgi:hypothetical protein